QAAPSGTWGGSHPKKPYSSSAPPPGHAGRCRRLSASPCSDALPRRAVSRPDRIRRRNRAARKGRCASLRLPVSTLHPVLSGRLQRRVFPGLTVPWQSSFSPLQMLPGFIHHTPVKKPESACSYLSVSDAQHIKDLFPESNLI